jgi:hypothetical protein
LKGEERVCHVTEADAPGANALDVSEKCLHARPPCVVGPRFREGLRPADAGSRVLPLCAAVGAAEPLGFKPYGLEPLGVPPVIKRRLRASGGCLGTERR